MSKVKIGLVQNCCGGDLRANAGKMERLVRSAHKAGAKIICLQEVSFTPYMATAMETGNFDLAVTTTEYPVRDFGQLARKLGIALIVPFFERDGRAFYNTAVCFGPKGEVLGKYRKNHIPLNSGFQEKYYFRPGDLGYPVIQTPWAKIGVSICWDHWFPEVQRIYAVKGAEIVFSPTALAYCDTPTARLDRSYKETWLTMLRGQAITSGFYFALANRVGKEGHLDFFGSSFIVGPDGRVISQLGEKEDGCLVSELDLSAVGRWHIHQQFIRDRRIDTYGELSGSSLPATGRACRN
jgi:N-carbamoylputrescine amidase